MPMPIPNELTVYTYNNNTTLLCLNNSDDLRLLFYAEFKINILPIIRHNVGLEITEDDGYSKMICSQCITKLKTIKEYIKLFHESDRKLRDTIIAKTNIETSDNVSIRDGQKLKKEHEHVPQLHSFKCYICNSASLGSRKNLIEHLATHVDKVPYTCRLCVMDTVVLTRVRTLNTHMKMHEQPVKCDYCDRRYSNTAGKYYHTQTYHLGGGAPCTVSCEICGKQYGLEVSLKQHLKYHTTILKCRVCDKVFNHPNKRRNHELTHNETKGYECVVCKKVLQTIESYDVHLKKHTQERSYTCSLCPKKFNTSFNLILHLKVHAKNYNYRPARSWVEHYTILSRNPMQYKCKYCERYSTDKVKNMISHLQAHFKEYKCENCDRSFATAKQLRAHYTTHTGEKSEICQHCGKCFSTKNNLRIHLKSHNHEVVTLVDQHFASVDKVSSPQSCSNSSVNKK
ncbi:zinc finger protein 43-like [Anopheles nili]|uniref:zinc finger protein 43-like n=1 Tax=Anopheles nili TaxID=185578 RepID=UPI00237B4346|nr:zinc finger protein 43-like [Anopheles nili]